MAAAAGNGPATDTPGWDRSDVRSDHSSDKSKMGDEMAVKAWNDRYIPLLDRSIDLENLIDRLDTQIKSDEKLLLELPRRIANATTEIQSVAAELSAIKSEMQRMRAIPLKSKSKSKSGSRSRSRSHSRSQSPKGHRAKLAKFPAKRLAPGTLPKR